MIVSQVRILEIVLQAKTCLPAGLRRTLNALLGLERNRGEVRRRSRMELLMGGYHGKVRAFS